MLSFLKRKSNTAPEETGLKGDVIYNFIVEDFKNFTNLPENGYDQLYKRELHGIILKNVVSKEEIGTLLSKLKEVPDKKKVFNDKNDLYPRGFASYLEKATGDEQQDFSSYFAEAHDYIDHFEKYLGIDLPSRIIKIFEHIGNKRAFKYLEGEGGKGVFPHSQFRSLYPNKGLFPVHCGNAFHHEYEKFYERLSSKARIKDQMSFFVLLQKAEKGGKLILFNILWEDGQNMIPVDGIQLVDGKIIDPIKSKKIKKMEVNLNEGDMLLFLGGPIWHKVTKVEGKVNRISLGGFFSASSDDKSIVCWA